MNQYQTLRITRAPENNISAAGDRYWLRIVQPSKESGADDAITTGEAAALADTLYNIDPCLEPDEQLEALAEITEEKLNQSAADVFGGDLEACRAALSGDYTEQIKIIRSHPDEEPPEPFQLELSAGRVASSGQRRETVTALLSINGQSSIDLEYPVVVNKNTPVEQQGVTFAWIGDVIGTSGLIDPPKIERSGNTIYWDGEATGQVKAKYPTLYDVATVEVPGQPTAVVGVGNAQNVKVLAYWHMMVFPGDISAPVTDDTVSKGAMQQLCGYMAQSPAYITQPTGGTGGTSSSEATTDPDPEPDESDDDSIYGCQTNDHSPFDSPAYYKKVCCDNMPGDINTCPESRIRRPGGVGMSKADIEKYTSGTGNVEFIPCAPDAKEGCGSVIMRMWVPKKNCCDEVAPLEWDHESSVEVIAPSSNGMVYVLNGKRPVTWSVRGRGFFTNSARTQREATTTVGNLRIYTDSTACGVGYVTADDGCSTVQWQVRATQGTWVFVKEVSGYALQSDGEWFISGAAETTDTSGGVVVSTLTSGKYKLEETIAQVGAGGSCHPINNPDTYCDCVDALFTNAMANPANNLGPRARDRKISNDVHTLDCFNLETCTFTSFGTPPTCTTYCWPCHPDMLISYGGGGNYNELCEFVSRRKLWEWTC